MTMAQNEQQQQAGSQKDAAPQQPQQQPQARPCPQDCRLCGMNQQMYCATQMVFNLSRTVQDISQRLSLLELSLDDVKEQVQPKQEEAQLSIPFSE